MSAPDPVDVAGGGRGSGHPALAPLYRLWLKPERERSVLRRHPWVFSGAVARLEALPGAQAGDLAQVLSADGRVLAIATLNPDGPLTARILRWDDGPIDGPWFSALLRRAAALRDCVIPANTDAYRLINAEGDGLPGLVVDRYGDYLVVQCLTAGMARLEPLWLAALVAEFVPAGVLERGERTRREPALGRRDGLRWGCLPDEALIVHECGLRFRVDLTHGQKTGFYLDQRENRRYVAQLARDRSMLNAFAYSGAFGVHAGSAGAGHVTAVETSAAALELAGENWALNDLPAERLLRVHAPVQGFLRTTRERFDLIVVDPPPFARDQSQVARAARAYKDLNLWALRRLAPGGFLATFSCSQHIGYDLFQKILFGASLDAGVPVQWLARLGAGPDHPVHLDHPQGEYLTGLLLRAAGAV